MTTLKISQVARLADVNIETVRYYERKGLIPEPPRLPSGYRQYSPDYVQRIKFIKHAQQLGFSLKEVTELLALRIEPHSACDEVKQQTEAKIAAIETKIHTLQQMQRVLTDLVSDCEQRQLTDTCPILKALESDKSISAENCR